MRICPDGKQRYKLVLSYDGTDTVGWQRQGHNPTSIQQCMENSLSEFYNDKITVVGSGRTDAGVHAEGQVAHFDAIPDPARTKRLVHALNRMSPRHIVIKQGWEVPKDFHSIHSTIKKTYKYRIFNSPQPTALFHRMTDWVHWQMDVDFLNEATSHILGTHDFTSFQTSGTERKTTVRTIMYAKWTQRSASYIDFTITGSGFLKQMVRNIVGTMLDLNKRGRPANDIIKILEARDRQAAGPTAEARGLSLYRVFYPQHLDFKSHKI